MTKRRFLVLAGSILAVCLSLLPVGTGLRAATDKLPARLTDQEFWKLVTDSSEQDGTFHSENLVSNEARFQYVLPDLTRAPKTGRVYMGVGSEQNFTYIAALKPAMAFIVDIRRGNLDLHLAYKALFELSANRADFVGRLFSKKQPAGLTTSSTAAQIFAAYANVPSSQALYDQNLKAIKAQLVTKHGYALSNGDLGGIDFVYGSWFESGPAIHYQLNGQQGGRGGLGGFPTYADLMTADDGTGKQRSYLANEESFLFMKDLETRNMLVPMVGNFAGPKAIRAVGAYVKQKEATVEAFYLSNVEQYLRQDGIWGQFCQNTATLPIDATSMFIRSTRGGFGGQAGFGRAIAGRTGPGGFASDTALMSAERAAGCGSNAPRR